LDYETATGSLLESPDEKERNQDGDIRAGGGGCVVEQRPLWAVLLQYQIYFSIKILRPGCIKLS
jgi:hypothetical protein